MSRRALLFGLAVSAMAEIAVADESGMDESGTDGSAAICRALAMLSEQEEGSTRALDLPGLGPATCTRSLGLGGSSARACRWPFTYRAPEASAAFERMVADVVACDGVVERAFGAGVNHPDSYDLRLFSRDDVTIAVSLKDKAALRETYVFLRAERGGD